MNGKVECFDKADSSKEVKDEYILFTPEERKECMKMYIEFSRETSKIERKICTDRKLAAARPPVYLTI